MAGSLEVRCRRTFTEHLQDWVAGYEVNQQKNKRDDQPNDRQSVQRAGREISQHGSLSFSGLGFLALNSQPESSGYEIIYFNSNMAQVMHHVVYVIIQHEFQSERL